MPTLRQILDRKTTIDLQAYGTSEGVEKGWDTRGRGRKAEGTVSEETRQEVAKYGNTPPTGEQPPSGPRDLGTIAREISKDWGGKVNYAAKPYLDAMRSLGSMKDNYGQDSAHSVVAYFLSNASSWRGPVAQRVKAELKGMLKGR